MVYENSHSDDDDDDDDDSNINDGLSTMLSMYSVY